jgi:uncharacterized membrane protein YheB (UPF0754 family)
MGWRPLNVTLVLFALVVAPWHEIDVDAFSTSTSSIRITPRQVKNNPVVPTLRTFVSHIDTTIPRQDRFRLTTKVGSEDEPKLGVLKKAKQKFIARPGTYLTIPIIAAIVGWFTNYLAVQMIFSPVHFWGIPLWRRPEVPLGLIGWQGIIPCKTKTMSISLVEMVTSQLLTVSEAFGRLDPRKMAQLLAPQVPELGMEVITDVFPKSLTSWPVRIWGGFSGGNQPSVLKFINVRVLTKMIADMQQNIDSIFSLESCVVNQMVLDRTKLGELFKKVGQKELDFLTNSGLWFGFLLGLIQMAVALVWDNPWSLSIGGGIVGLATNWLALKWIFEPVNPTKIGPFILQGQFLRRQTEVAAEFSKFFADKILSSPKLWDSILTDPNTKPAFQDLVAKHFGKVCSIISLGLFRGLPNPETVGLVTRKAIEKLPNHIHVLHAYVDKTLGLQDTLRVKMEAMSSAKFERVLHPIFEEDELTLILAGAVLGFAAGLVQQGIATGSIKLPNPLPRIRNSLVVLKANLMAIVKRIRKGQNPPDGTSEEGVDIE